MKASELAKILLENPDWDILMSIDPEGNGYHLLDGIGENVYREDRYECEIGYSKLTPKLESMGYSEEDVMEDGIPCYVLWP